MNGTIDIHIQGGLHLKVTVGGLIDKEKWFIMHGEEGEVELVELEVAPETGRVLAQLQAINTFSTNPVTIWTEGD